MLDRHGIVRLAGLRVGVGEERQAAPHRWPPVRRRLLLDRHRRIRGHRWQLGDDHLLPERGTKHDVDARQGRHPGGERAGGDDDGVGGDVAAGRAHARDPFPGVRDLGHGGAGDEGCSTTGRRGRDARRIGRGGGVAGGQSLDVEPAVIGSIAGAEHAIGEPWPSSARLVAGEELDVGEAPLALARHEPAGALERRVGERAEEVAAVPQPEVPAIEAGSLGEGVEELDTLANGGDLLGIVELEAKGAGRHRRGQGPQRRMAFEDHHPQARRWRRRRRSRSRSPRRRSRRRRPSRAAHRRSARTVRTWAAC